MFETVVTCLGLGLWERVRYDDGVKVVRQVRFTAGGLGLLIVFFQQELDVELFLGVIHRSHILDDFVGHFPFFVEWDEDGVDGKVFILEGGQFFIGDLDVHALDHRESDAGQLEENDQEIERAE